MKVRRLDDNHDMTFGHGLANMAFDQEAVAQRVRTRLYLLFGEWFLNTDAGVPYLQQITTKPMDLFLTESIIRSTITNTEGIATIDSFSMNYNSTTRRLAVDTTVATIYGTTVNIKVDNITVSTST
ncbi:MAG: hypothetical protein E6R08_06455 [Nevskiaceae bacterium]|nr:MAG: hypothetical protein E6R08_06455 [Nevskiaceae bacterium]